MQFVKQRTKLTGAPNSKKHENNFNVQLQKL